MGSRIRYRDSQVPPWTRAALLAAEMGRSESTVKTCTEARTRMTMALITCTSHRVVSLWRSILPCVTKAFHSPCSKGIFRAARMKWTTMTTKMAGPPTWAM